MKLSGIQIGRGGGPHRSITASAPKAQLGARGQDDANVLKASRVGALAHCAGMSLVLNQHIPTPI